MKLLVKKYFEATGIAYLQEIKPTAKLFTSTTAREIRVKMLEAVEEKSVIEEDIKILDTFTETTKKVVKDGEEKTYTNKLYDWE